MHNLTLDKRAHTTQTSTDDRGDSAAQTVVQKKMEIESTRHSNAETMHDIQYRLQAHFEFIMIFSYVSFLFVFELWRFSIQRNLILKSNFCSVKMLKNMIFVILESWNNNYTQTKIGDWDASNKMHQKQTTSDFRCMNFSYCDYTQKVFSTKGPQIKLHIRQFRYYLYGSVRPSIVFIVSKISYGLRLASVFIKYINIFYYWYLYHFI